MILVYQWYRIKKYMNTYIDLFYKYSVLFFKLMLVIVVLFVVILIIKSLPIVKQLKIMQPKMDNINRNVEVSNRKVSAVQNKTRKSFTKLGKIIKYGLLSRIILGDFKKEESKNIGTFAKVASKSVIKQNETQLLKQLRKRSNQGKLF